ncbi:MAG: DUF3887 domain-containing protein [Lacisediminihabitans sp.]
MPHTFSTVASQIHQQLGAVLAAPVLTDKRDALAPLRASLEIQAQVTALVATAVEDARGAGRTWQDIGDVLGISRQAAFQRFGKPIDPRTGETMNTTPLAEAALLAENALNSLAGGRWDEVTNQFDEQMRAGLTGDALAAAWAQIIGTAGAYERHGATESARTADLTVTNTPLSFEAADFVARIAFRDDHTIAGLYILPAEQSSPSLHE